MCLFRSQSSVVIAVMVVANTAFASQFKSDSITTSHLEDASLSDAEELLSGHLRNVVFFPKIENALQNISSGVRGDVGLLSEKIDNILVTSYRKRSKEYRLNCNFLLMSVYLRSFNRIFDEMESCRKGCRNDVLERIKIHLEYDYADLQRKVELCRSYLSKR